MKIKLLFLLFTTIFYGQIPSYYGSVDFSQTGNALKNQLATLITNTNTNQLPYTSSSPDVWDILQAADLTTNDPSKVFLIYGYDDFDLAFKNDRTDNVTNICSGSCPIGSWNREHTYPLSLGTPALVTSSPGPGTDAHHIRASDVAFNADRGNRLFSDGEGNAGLVGTLWYPGDEWKGDIARMMMYMYVRYNNRCLPNNVGSGGNTYHPDMPDIFLEWNEEDPVSNFELIRNNVVQSFQGNRNPFIDNPYLATLIWGGPQAPDSWNTLSCPDVTTWNGSTWDNGTPNKGIRAVINGNLISNGNLEFCSLDINGTSQVVLQSGDTFTVVRGINVSNSASFTVENNANLIQINDIPNTGNITVLKESAPMLRLDYTSWSSPVLGQNLFAFSPNTLTNRFYEYITGGTTSATAYSSVDPIANDFIPAKGYIIRSPNNWSTNTASPFVGQFTGIPNNGKYEVNTATGYNMLGNPYPASIEGSHFIASNRTVETLYFWTHTIAASGGTYPQNNFASYTTLGGVAAAAGGLIPDGSIKPGQGFYFYSNEDETLVFHNALRYDVKNTQFFRMQNEVAEKDLFRLNLFQDETPLNQILLGYSSDSTLEFDLGIDGKAFNTSNSMIYTNIDDVKYVINGRGIFSDDDKIPLGFQATQSGQFTISLEDKLGLFSSKSIYIKDNFTNNIFDLSHSNYIFTTNEGVFQDRFEIIYKVEETVETDLNGVIVFSGNTNINLVSDKNIISSVYVYNALGQLIYEKLLVEKKVFQINDLTKNKQVLFVIIQLENGKEIKKKIVF